MKRFSGIGRIAFPPRANASNCVAAGRLAMLAVVAAGLVLACAATGAASAANTVRIKNLHVLNVVYRGQPGAKDYMDEHAVTQARNGCELGRLFYFRNSRARLNCEFEFLVIDAPAPPNDGPTMEHIEADLRRRGVKPGVFDGVFVTGMGLSGNWGGFNILDGTAACFGGHSVRGGLDWYPQDDPDVAYGTAWNFAHEFQHAIDLVIAENSRTPMLHAHPYTDRNEPFFAGFYLGGEHWDWIACTFREFDDWVRLRGVRNEVWECTDADGDGLADDDPRLPMDEERFGSDPGRKDSDGDGLDDLGEFVADRYGASDPRKSDTDGDGVPDGQDPYPVVALRPSIAYAAASASRPPPLLLDSVFVRNDAGGPCSVGATWNDDGLRLRFDAPRPFRVHLKLDGSAANGFWEGGDTYLIRVSEKEAVFDGLGLQGPVPGAAVSSASDESGKHITLELPARIGQGVSKEINYGGKREPEDTVDGLTLVPGRSIGLNVIYEFEDRTRAVLTPHHTMYAARLADDAGRLERPRLRGPRRTRATPPVVEVTAIRPGTAVEVTCGGEVVGARIGSGPVYLASPRFANDGEYPLEVRLAGEARGPADPAEPGGRDARTMTLVVDRTASPPAMRGDGKRMTAACEPGAEFELWWGLRGAAVAPLASARAGASGEAVVACDPAALDGWLVTGYEGSRFEKRVYFDAWPVIDRNFQGGAPDPRLPGENFSYRFDAYFVAPEAGVYTFELSSDDGSRLYIDGELAINHWGHHGMSPRSAAWSLTAGVHQLHVDYYEEDGWAGVRLRYAPPGGELTERLPVRRVPPALDGVEFFGVQTDELGNRSAFAAAGD